MCEQCGKEFLAYDKDIKNGHARFCSLSCYWSTLAPVVDRTCERCGKVFSIHQCKLKRGEGRFCSKACASGKPPIVSHCGACGKEFKVGNGVSERGYGKYCSRRCWKQSIVGEGSPHWLGGLSFFPYCPKFSKGFKERVREKFDRKCFICGARENGKRHSVHHIDYNKNSICNGKEWAFVPLCPSHHSTTNANRWHWFNLLINYWAMNPEINFRGDHNFIF